MKVSPVSRNFQANNTINSNKTVAFGFGEDYVNDDFLAMNDYVHKESDASVLQYLFQIGEFFYTLCKERFGNGSKQVDEFHIPRNQEPTFEERDGVSGSADINFDDLDI